MKQENYQTIIIGGGISGLSCASELQKHKKKFLLISENIGGRILSSKDGNVNYGAYYVTKDYANVLPFVRLGDKICPLSVLFHNKKKGYTIISRNLFAHSLQFMKLLFYLYKFRRHYNAFKKRCAYIPQKQALSQDTFLFSLYNQKATTFIEQKRIKEIAYTYLAEMLSATTFLSIRKHTAFTFLQFCLPIIVPTFMFRFQEDNFIRGFKDKILIDVVVRVKKEKDFYALYTKMGRFFAKNVVIATPPSVTQALLSLKKIKKPVCVHMSHIKGVLKEIDELWQESVFMPSHEIFVIAKQLDGSFLVYSHTKSPPLYHYFSKYNIIKHIYWNPAFHLEGNALLETEYLPNLYITGDHNICGMEDAFISGLFVARQILKRKNE